MGSTGAEQSLGPSPITGDDIARIIRGNLIEEFDRLRGVPGFQLDPVPWETVRKLVDENTTESLGKLGRSPAGSVVYWKFKEKMDKDWASIADYMQWTVFGFETELTQGAVMPQYGRKRVIVPQPDTKNPTIIWRPNDFPYNFDEGVEHHNIWSTIPLQEADVLKVIDEHRKGYQYVWFTNPFPLASIPSVWHAHCISRPLKGSSKRDKAVNAMLRGSGR